MEIDRERKRESKKEYRKKKKDGSEVSLDLPVKSIFVAPSFFLPLLLLLLEERRTSLLPFFAIRVLFIATASRVDAER